MRIKITNNVNIKWYRNCKSYIAQALVQDKIIECVFQNCKIRKVFPTSLIIKKRYVSNCNIILFNNSIIVNIIQKNNSTKLNLI